MPAFRMSGKIPLRRKLEVAFAGYLIDCQATDPTFLPGHKIVCGTTGRSPDDPAPTVGPPIEPELPYTSVGCKDAKDRPDFPSGYGMKDAVVIIYSKSHASDDPRPDADTRVASVEDLVEDADSILAALNQPPLSTTADNRWQKALYLYAIEDIETMDDHSTTTWEDEILMHVVCQSFDPAYA